MPICRPLIYAGLVALAACSAAPAPPPGPTGPVAPTAPTVAITPESPRSDAELKATIVTPSTDPQGDAVSYAYAWTQNGQLQADLTTDTVPATRTTKGDAWSVSVTPTDGTNAGPAGQANATIGNAPPVVTVAFSVPNPSKKSGLVAVPTAVDADGDNVTLAYEWSRNGKRSGLDPVATVDSSQLRRGDTWSVTVTSTDGTDAGAPATAEAVIANSKPEIVRIELSPNPVTRASVLDAVVTRNDADGDPVMIRTAWTVDGVVVPNMDGSSLPPTLFRKGVVVTATATPYDGEPGEPVSASITPQNAPPSAPRVSLPTRVRDQDDVTCTVTAGSDADGDTLTYAFSWTKNGQPLVGVVTGTVPAVDTAPGDRFTCAAIASDGTDASPSSAAASTAVNARPALASVTLRPSVATKASPIDADPAIPTDADGDVVSLAYAWTRNGSALQGQTAASLPASTFSRGDVIGLTVTPSDATEAGAPVQASTTVQNALPAAPSVTLPAAAFPGTDLSCEAVAGTTPGTDADGDALTYAFAWTRNGQPYMGAASTSASSTVPAADVALNDVYTCALVASDGVGAPVSSVVQSLTIAADMESVLSIFPGRNITGYYRFNGNAQDSSGLNKHGTPNGVTYVAGRKGLAARFDGTASITFATAIATSTTEMTIAAWVKPDATAVGTFYSFGPTTGCNPTARQGLLLSPGRLQVNIGCNTTSAASPPSSVPGDAWTHVAIARDAQNQVWIYVNGVQQGSPVSDTAGRVIGLGNDVVGGTWNGGRLDSLFRGLVDELVVISKAGSKSGFLLPQEVATLYSRQQ
jgi:hypothetical protein